MLLTTFFDILFFISLFNIKITKSQFVIVSLLTGILKLIVCLLIQSPLYIALNILIGVLILHFVLHQTYEKSILGETLNMLTMISARIILTKIISLFITNYLVILMVAMIITKCLIICAIRLKPIHINLGDHLQVNHKRFIYMISVLGIMFAFANEVQTSLSLLNVVSSILYIYMVVSNIERIDIAEAQELKIHCLELHNKTLVNMCEKLKSFKHDFANFVLALDGYAKTENLAGVKRMSKSALAECNEVNKMGALNPEIIKNPAIYSILTNKFYHAREENITMNIEILESLNDQEINNYEVCRILGILLDNAIEAAKSTEEKIINVRFVRDSKPKRELIVIENSYNDKTIDVSKIFEKGYTSKEDVDGNHGIGLWNIKSILMKNEDLNLYTTADELFRQQLEIY